MAGASSPEKRGGKRAERRGWGGGLRGCEIQGEMGRVIESLGGNLKNACEKQDARRGEREDMESVQQQNISVGRRGKKNSSHIVLGVVVRNFIIL